MTRQHLETDPDWVPDSAMRYLAHTVGGQSIRALARSGGCHASTVLRQIRRIEQRRDDPLVDHALHMIGQARFRDTSLRPQTPKSSRTRKDQPNMQIAALNTPNSIPDPQTLGRAARRVLPRLCERGAVLAVAEAMDKAVVVREQAEGGPARTAVLDKPLAEAMALNDWIASVPGNGERGRIVRYGITSTGRAALNRMMAEDESALSNSSLAEAQSPFAAQHRSFDTKSVARDSGGSHRVRYNLSESPLAGLARRRDKDGKPFLSAEMVSAGERLREDFEIAQMGPRVAQNWDRFLTAGTRGGYAADSGTGDGPSGARRRVSDALSDLGPGLSDVVLRCCCYLEGLENAEKHMGWSARSGKIVLRIALQRLIRHYEEVTGSGGRLIG